MFDDLIILEFSSCHQRVHANKIILLNSFLHKTLRRILDIDMLDVNVLDNKLDVCFTILFLLVTSGEKSKEVWILRHCHSGNICNEFLTVSEDESNFVK